MSAERLPVSSRGRVLGFEPVAHFQYDGMNRVVHIHPNCGLAFGLTEHAANPGGEFSERTTGLDHLAFGVATLGDLQAWRTRLGQLGAEHSDRREPGGHVLAVRDPDNIQLELFAPVIDNSTDSTIA